MSLHQYHVDLSSLTIEERENAIDIIESRSYNGLFFESGFQSGIFYLYDTEDPNLLHLPEKCNLTRSYIRY